MDCRVISAQLIAYYFATSIDEERQAVDAHLLECTACLRVFLGMKHHIERGAARAEAPSDRARLRLRSDVQAAFRPTPRARVRTLFARPIPLYQGLAAAVLAVIIAVLGPSLSSRAQRRFPDRETFVDTARPTGENLTVY